MERAEFIKRFKVEMMRIVPSPNFDDGSSIPEYADEIAPTYWDEPWQRQLGPEECARADVSYWGE